jgi:glycosyltransferase involved in cell wall biosynthesis
MGKKKLLHVTTSLKMGGAERFLEQLVGGLLQHFDQRVITFYDGYFVERIRALGIPVYVVRGVLCRYDPVCLWRLISHIYVWRPNCIHAILWSASTLSKVCARIVGVPLVCGLHSPLNSNRGVSAVRTYIDRMLHSWANCYVAVSTHIQKQYRGLCQNVVVIENGVDDSACECKSKSGFDSHAFVIGSVGRLEYVKNHRLLIDVLVRARSIIPQLHVIIVGEGSLRNDLIAYAQQCGVGDRVTLCSGDARAYYEMFDLFVLPSFFEGLSYSLLEAMCAGVPVITTHRGDGGHDVVIDRETGYLFDPYNVDELVCIIMYLFDHKDVRIQIARSAHRVVKCHFSAARMVRRYRILFESLCKKTEKVQKI